MKALLLFAFMLSACTAAELSPEGQRVAMINAMGSSDINKYTDLGPVGCSVGDNFSFGDEENCKNSLRNDAGKLGADFVLIESINHRKCDGSTSTACVAITARAYRKK